MLMYHSVFFFTCSPLIFFPCFNCRRRIMFFCVARSRIVKILRSTSVYLSLQQELKVADLDEDAICTLARGFEISVYVHNKH